MVSVVLKMSAYFVNRKSRAGVGIESHPLFFLKVEHLCLVGESSKMSDKGFQEVSSLRRR